MLKPGRYVAEQDGDMFHAYRYVVEVKETEKSYVFKLVEAVNRYAYDHIERIFDKNGRAVLRKDKPSRHAMRVWENDSFTIYPFQAGIPFYFQKEKTTVITYKCDGVIRQATYTTYETWQAINQWETEHQESNAEIIEWEWF